MSDSEIAIAITDVSRVFKRYRHPGYRVMEAFGLPLPKNAYDEFWALRGISLELRRGESLGLIGQNGAGKTTLLNIVCGRLRPSTGTVTVRGTIQALMDVGTGFHPEFTGRENIFSALAYQGITGRAAKAEFDEIVEFSELAEFIDQSVKTYSSGMYARLAFSTATAITPDVLIIDEVLGAGDAYFSAKCVDRMRRLMKDAGATVLFVSHDIAAVQRMCDRAVWIERGQIRMEGDTLDISKSYYADVNAREEARLRAQTTLAIARMRRRDGDTRVEGVARQFLFRLVAATGEMPRSSHPIRRIAMVTTDNRRFEVLPGAPMDNDGAHPASISTDPEFVLWSRPKTIAGELVRCFEDTGGSDRQAPIWFQDPSGTGWLAEAIEIEHAAVADDPIAIEIYEPGGYRRLGLLTAPEPTQGWRTERFAVADTHPLEPDVAEAGPREKWQSDEARFTRIDAYNAATGMRQHVFRLGEPIVFRITVELRAPVPQCWLACIIFDALGNRVSLLVNEINQGIECGQSEIRFQVDQLSFRQGEYVVSFELLPIFDYNWSGPQRIPYLCHWDRCIYFKVDEDYHGTILLGLVALTAQVTVVPANQAAQRPLTFDAAE